MNRRFLPAFLVCALLLAALILFEYGKSFSFYFVGDDFAFIEYVLAEKAGIFLKPSCFYHYYPLGLIFIVFPSLFNVFEPEYFVAVNFLLFFMCSIMIMLLHRKIAGGLLGGFFAAILFATAIPNSEVIYWKTTTSTIAMTLFSLVSLGFYIRFLEKKSTASFLASMFAFLASILCMEQGVVTFGILFLYDLIFFLFPQFTKAAETDRKRIAYGFLRRNFFLLLIPVSMMFIKTKLGAQLSAFPLSQLLRHIPNLMPKTLIRLFDFNFLFSGFLSSDTYIWLVVAVIMLAFSAYLFFKRTAAALFFLLASIGSILTISFAAGGPNERYYCLPLAFFTCFLSLFIRDVAAAVIGKAHEPERENSSRIGIQKAHILLYAALCLAIAFIGFRGNLRRRAFWQAASQIERNIVGQVENIYLTGSFSRAGGRKIYLLNMPSFIVTRANSIFYICSNSLMPDLRRRLMNADDEIELAATGHLFEMKLNDERVVYRVLGRENMLDREHLRKLADEGNLLLQFSPYLKTVVPLEKK